MRFLILHWLFISHKTCFYGRIIIRKTRKNYTTQNERATQEIQADVIESEATPHANHRQKLIPLNIKAFILIAFDFKTLETCLINALKIFQPVGFVKLSARECMF